MPGQYADIQAAVDACSNGDVVVVAPGEYEGFDFAGKAITVRSTSPANPSVVAATIIDGDLRLWLHTIRIGAGAGRTTVLDGLTVTKGETAILCDGSATIRRCVFLNTRLQRH